MSGWDIARQILKSVGCGVKPALAFSWRGASTGFSRAYLNMPNSTIGRLSLVEWTLKCPAEYYGETLDLPEIPERKVMWFSFMFSSRADETLPKQSPCRRKGRTVMHNYYFLHQNISSPNCAIKICYIETEAVGKCSVKLLVQPWLLILLPSLSAWSSSLPMETSLEGDNTTGLWYTLFTQSALLDPRIASSSNTGNMTVILLLPNHGESVSDAGNILPFFSYSLGWIWYCALISSNHQQALQ